MQTCGQVMKFIAKQMANNFERSAKKKTEENLENVMNKIGSHFCHSMYNAFKLKCLLVSITLPGTPENY